MAALREPLAVSPRIARRLEATRSWSVAGKRRLWSARRSTRLELYFLIRAAYRRVKTILVVLGLLSAR